jgi:hypothetical protein
VLEIGACGAAAKVAAVRVGLGGWRRRGEIRRAGSVVGRRSLPEGTGFGLGLVRIGGVGVAMLVERVADLDMGYHCCGDSSGTRCRFGCSRLYRLCSLLLLTAFTFAETLASLMSSLAGRDGAGGEAESVLSLLIFLVRFRVSGWCGWERFLFKLGWFAVLRGFG